MPSCQEAGVFGAVPGVIGTIQAVETIKLLLGVGTSLLGRFLVLDALDMDFLYVKIERNPDCPLCGDHPTVTALMDYELSYGLS